MLRENMCIIRSKNRNLFTQKINKFVLNRDKDKRQIQSDGCTYIVAVGTLQHCILECRFKKKT